MPDKYVRKIPQPREKSRPTKATAPPAEQSIVPAAAWLAGAAAGFIAWGQAAERAKREFDLAWRDHLQTVVLHVVDKGFRREFRDYCRLARHVQSPDWLQLVEARLSSTPPGQIRRARWIVDACRRK